MEQKARERWGTRFGFIMAAAGSAIGLGNIWRFPYLTGMNGGGAFIVIYLGCVLLVGLSIITAEFAIGRRTQLAAVGAYKAYSRSWSFAGVFDSFIGNPVPPLIWMFLFHETLSYIYTSIHNIKNNHNITNTEKKKEKSFSRRTFYK